MGSDRPSWAEGDSAEFLQYGDCFIPERELQTEIFCALIPEAQSSALVVELCCGEGRLSEAILDRHPDCRALALDGSAAMRERATERLGRFGKRAEVRAFDLPGTEWRRFDRPLHACVSSYAVHHLTADEKRILFGDIARLLAPGGVFVIADLMEPETARARKLAAEQWDTCVRERSMRLHGNLGAYDYFVRSGWNYFSAPGPDPMDHPSGLREQLEWMRDAGFGAVDVHWVKAGMALFSGLRHDVGRADTGGTKLP